MLFQLNIAIAIIGSTIAGIYDLKTTEIPDKISVSLIIIGLISNAIISILNWNAMYIFQSLAVGGSFFTLSFLMYLGGQWGGGDAKVMTGIGTLIPSLQAINGTANILPFPVLLLSNIFIVGAIYIIIYAIFYAFIKRHILTEFTKSIRVKTKMYIAFFICLFVFTFIIVYLLDIIQYIHIFLAMNVSILGLLLLWQFLKTVQNVGFTWEIDSKELKAGDMLSKPMEDIGETEDNNQLNEIKQISLFLSPFLLLPIVMFLTSYPRDVYFYLATIPALFSLINGMIFLVMKLIPTNKEMKLFKEDSNRIRGLTEAEVKKIREKKDKVEVREGVRFCPVFPIAVIITILYGNLINLVFLI